MKVLITDFGTAFDWSKGPGATTSGHLEPIAINYIAPEVAQREDRNESSDTWSRGCVFIEMTVSNQHYHFSSYTADGSCRLY
jgi:serine/threonine protein kinase